MYKVDDTIFFQKKNIGIFKIENGEAVLHSDDEKIKNLEVISIFDFNQELLIQTRENGLFICNNDGVLSEWDTSSKAMLSRLSVYSSKRLKDGSFVLGTISNGLFLLDQFGNVVFNMDQSSGLSNNTVLALFEDLSGNIWLGLDNGVNTLNLKSPYRFYRDKLGVLGTIYAAAKTNEFLYLGTNQGLFYKNLNTDDSFKLIAGTNGQVWSLRLFDDSILCGHDKGTFQITGTQARKISSENGTWDFKIFDGAPNLMLQGNYKGLNVLEKSPNGNWIYKNKIEGFDISSRYFEFINKSELLVSHEHKGVYKLVLDDGYTKVTSVKKEGVGKGIGSGMVSYNNRILYVLKEGVYYYNTAVKEFQKDSLLSNFFENGQNYISGKFINDSQGKKIWGFFKNQIVYVEPGQLTNKPKVTTIPLPSSLRKSKSGFENILYLTEDNYLLGTTEGYLIINLNQFSTKDYNIKFNGISYSCLQGQMQPLKLSSEAKLENKDNNLHFSFSVPDFDKFSPSLYQYRLLGIYDEWSSWQETSDVFFENLPHGDYIFEARAKVGNQTSSNTVKYNFSIARPWYATSVAIALYAVVFVLILLLLQIFNRRYYKKQKTQVILKKEKELEIKELENQKRLMQFKNQNLRQDIDNKNRELGLSTMNLIRKNEFLNELKNELSNIDKNEDVKRVIKIIDKSINNTEDWKLFEEAFNNADKDFLKKIKSAHPSLTPNDLKLCTYLRLNLASKEIAPLLNISHRSVEVKRYRLRKKMKLPHEASLTNYILEI
jgi:DNA-binding CsgD family transcriptional regulator